MVRLWTVGAVVVALAAARPAAGANVKQVEHTIKDGPTETTLQLAWRVQGGGADAVTAIVSSAEIAADKAVKRKVQFEDLYRAMAKAARRSAQHRQNVEVAARASAAGVQLSATGPPKAAKAALADAQAAMDQRRATWMAENQVFEPEPGKLSYDHAAVIIARTDAVAPVAAALRSGTDSDRAFIDRALTFSQSIPYQKGRRGADTGFQRPLALLARNKGDCDGKAALFLSLVRAELPDLQLAMVYIPGHALVGLGLPAEPGDVTFTIDGVSYVYAEPVGPAAVPLGQTAPENRKAAKRGHVRVVPGP